MKRHSSIDINGLLNVPRVQLNRLCLSGVLTDNDGNPTTPDALLAEANQWKEKGCVVMPSGDCDNYDETGRCKGHTE